MTRVRLYAFALWLCLAATVLAQGPATPVAAGRAAAPRVNPAALPVAVAPATPQKPAWVDQLSVAEREWVDQALRYWEARSDKITLFDCHFQRWDYDGGPVEMDQGRVVRRHARVYAEGTIKYGQPDKGLYHVEKLSVATPSATGAAPQYVEQNPELGEHWICDGEKVYSFEASKKQVTVTPLPPEMRGKAIADGPLPFLFGAKAETIKARYWVRGLVAAPDDPSKKNKFWLEAVPTSRQDAQNFKMVRIVLDGTEYLPESIEIFAPNYDPPRNDARQTYVFSNRVTKDAATIADSVAKGLDPLKIFHRDFYDVRIPLGWKKVEQRATAPAGPPQQAQPPQRPLAPIAR